MAEQGQPADNADSETASPKGGWTPSRGFWAGMAGVIFFAGVLAAAGAVAATRNTEPVSAPQAPPPPVEITTPPRHATPEPDFTADIGGAPPHLTVPATIDAASATAAPASAAAVSPAAVASSWSVAPVFASPAPAAPIGDSAAWLARQAADLYGINIVLDGQDWGDSDSAQAQNIGAVISAMDLLPRTVASSIAANPAGSLSILSNRQGRTQDGWQPYGNATMSFYANSGNGASGYRAANQIVLATGSDGTSIAHEILHAYQFRNAGPDEYALALLGDEMRSFMAASGWRQTASDAEVRAVAHQPWDAINGLFAYEGRPLTYTGEDGRSVTLTPTNPIEAFAAAGAIYYARPGGMALPAWPEYWAWFRDNVG